MQFPLPSVCHVPGSGSQPEQSLLETVKNLAPNPTRADNWCENDAYRYAWRLFEARFYWEAHEVWECVWWRAAPASPERALLQGLIQIANSLLKQSTGRTKASQKILKDGLNRLHEHCDIGVLMGVNVSALYRLLDSIAE
jgi:uncharacterized protein